MIKAILIDHMGIDTDPAYRAWVSTGKDIDRTEEDAVALIERLANDGHLGCFEHLVASFEIHCPIFIARQIMRHRTFSFNELSGRYKDFSDSAAYIPDYVEKDIARLMEEIWEKSIDTYKLMRMSGVKKEVARMVLPLNTMTRFVMTGNLRNWAHFIKLREDPHAQHEVQIIAKAIKNWLLHIWPISVQAVMK